MRTDSPAAAKGALAWLLRRRWGMCALRENARLLLARLTYVGRGAAAAVQRRAHASEASLARARVDACRLHHAGAAVPVRRHWF